MALLGISLLVASVVYVLIRPPAWLLSPRRAVSGSSPSNNTRPSSRDDDGADDDDEQAPPRSTQTVQNPPKSTQSTRDTPRNNTRPAPDKLFKSSPPVSSAAHHTPVVAVPSHPPPPPIHTHQPDSPMRTTPEATPAPDPSPDDAVPSLALSEKKKKKQPPTPSVVMPPPPPSTGRLPTSAQRARGPCPLPNRNPPPSRQTALAPPPARSSRPQKPPRKVMLEPGRSPLDWARVSGAGADLRGVDPSAPYLRVTPSMLGRQTGRGGTDAWMVLNGRVYNVSPYAAYHPGGVPELMRGAGRDGTKLFAEIHPWVNHETMLSACLVGLLVEEPEGGSRESDMDRMD